MARLSLGSLRTRLLLLVLLAVIPALGLTLYTNLEERQLRKALVQEHAMRLSRLVSADYERLIEDALAQHGISLADAEPLSMSTTRLSVGRPYVDQETLCPPAYSTKMLPPGPRARGIACNRERWCSRR